MTSNLCIYAAGNLQQGVVSERKKCSKVWLYFTKTDDNSAAVCKIRLSNKGGNTSAMLKHPSMQHGLELQESHIFDTLRISATASQPRSTSVTEGKNPVMIVILAPAGGPSRFLVYNFTIKQLC